MFVDIAKLIKKVSCLLKAVQTCCGQSPQWAK